MIVSDDVPYLPNRDSQPTWKPDGLQILTPAEIGNLTTEILSELENSQISPQELQKLSTGIQEFRRNWEKAFSRFGNQYSGELTYRNLILNFEETIRLPQLESRNAISTITSMLSTSKSSSRQLSSKQLLLARNKLKAKPQLNRNACYQVVENLELQKSYQRLLTLPKHLQVLQLFTSPSTLEEIQHYLPSEWETTETQIADIVQKLIDLELLKEKFPLPKFTKPIFIVSAPRAGSTLLFETLAQFPDLWTIGDESHEIIEGIPELHPAAQNFSSNRLTQDDVLPHIPTILTERFTRQLQDREARGYLNFPINERLPIIRFLEKTPKNALRIPFLKTVFPEALFIYLYREPRENISSLMEGWRSQRFPSYQFLSGWPYRQWCFLLTPGWESLQEASIVEIAAHQWYTANAYILDDLETLPQKSWHLVNYYDLIQDPKKTISQIAEFAQLRWDKHIEEILSQSLPVARRTLSEPSPDKWRKNEKEIEAVLPGLEPLLTRLKNKIS